MIRMSFLYPFNHIVSADGDHDYLSVMKSNLEVLKKALD